MEDERWLRSLLDVCRFELERADTAESPPSDDYLEDLRMMIKQLENQLADSVRGTMNHRR
jgi:hypothetical protein